MKVTILGAGNVGSTLGKRWSTCGYSITYGVRDPSHPKCEALAKQGADVRVSSVGLAALDALVVVVATPWTATRAVLEAAGDLRDKIIIDCTNPIRADFSGLEFNHETSAGEKVAEWSGSSRVVKAFNTTGYNVMNDPHFGSELATMFICGDSQEAKNTTAELVRDLDFEVVDCGPLKQSRYLEATAWLWISLAIKYGQGREIAFRLLHR